MQRLVLVLTVALLVVGVSAWQGGATIVNNSGSTGADSLPIPFFAIDSVGNPGYALIANDSIYLWVYYPNGALAFTDTVLYNDGGLTITTVAGLTHYVWKLAVADIDGASPTSGTYSYVVALKDNRGSEWNTMRTGMFQLYATRDFNTFADSTMLYGKSNLDSSQAQDGWIAKEASVARDTLLTIRDTVLTKNVLDSLQAQDGWVAKEASVARDTLLTIRDTVLTKNVLDSMQAQDGWVAKEASVARDTLLTIRDTVLTKNVLDSMQAQDGWVAKEASLVRDTLKSDSVIALLNTDIYATLQEVKEAIFDSLAVWPMYLDMRSWVLDTLPMGFGYPGNTVAASSTLKTNADADTLFLRDGADTSFAIIYYHVGGSANGEPDSTKAIRW